MDVSVTLLAPPHSADKQRGPTAAGDGVVAPRIPDPGCGVQVQP